MVLNFCVLEGVRHADVRPSRAVGETIGGRGGSGEVVMSTPNVEPDEFGVTIDDIRQVALCAISTRGFPAAVAALGWIDDVAVADASEQQ